MRDIGNNALKYTNVNKADIQKLRSYLKHQIFSFSVFHFLFLHFGSCLCCNRSVLIQTILFPLFHVNSLFMYYPTTFYFSPMSSIRSHRYIFQPDNRPQTPNPLQEGLQDRSSKRMDLFVWLDLTDEEKASMREWRLLLHLRAHDLSWQDVFRGKRRLIREPNLDIQDVQREITGTIEGVLPGESKL